MLHSDLGEQEAKVHIVPPPSGRESQHVLLLCLIIRPTPQSSDRGRLWHLGLGIKFESAMPLKWMPLVERSLSIAAILGLFSSTSKKEE